MNTMTVVPLGVVDVVYYHNHVAQYLQNLLITVEALPFLQDVIDALFADPSVGWHCQACRVLGDSHIHAIEREIAPIHIYGDDVEAFTFEDHVSEPERIQAFSLYSRIAEHSDFADVQALHDAETLAEYEMLVAFNRSVDTTTGCVMTWLMLAAAMAHVCGMMMVPLTVRGAPVVLTPGETAMAISTN